MKESSQNNKIYGIIGTIIFHALLLLLLWMITFERPVVPVDTGSGVLVQLGNTDEANGMFEPFQPEDVITQETQDETAQEPDEDIISQETEESDVTAKPKEKEEKQKKETTQKEKKPKEDTRIDDKIKNAFGKGNSADGSRGTSSQGEGVQGNPFGNSSSGELTGVGGYGGYNLGGRGLVGGLPRPQYDSSKDEGTIAVSITVNQQGRVISAIATVKGSKGTAFSNPNLRKSAENAARKAVFETGNSAGNQSGVIVYHFKQN